MNQKFSKKLLIKNFIFIRRNIDNEKRMKPRFSSNRRDRLSIEENQRSWEINWNYERSGKNSRAGL